MEILSDDVFVFEEALAIDNRTSKILNAVGFRSKILVAERVVTDKRILNLHEESEIAYKLFLKNRNGRNFISYRSFITMLHKEIDNNSGKKLESRSNHFRILINKYLVNLYPVTLQEVKGNKVLSSKL
tara:strand:- start:452 stop:835 length:384 start_codon:yes stop_codon:yes gene_type:complete